MSEHDQTKAVVQWFKLQYPQYKDCIIGIPNGAHIAGHIGARKKKIDKLKSEGMKAGTSDLFIAVPKGSKCGLWVEMKDVKKTLCHVKKEQREHLELMQKMNYEAVWCAGFDIARAAIETYMNEKPVE